jgi:hypothetical protein
MILVLTQVNNLCKQRHTDQLIDPCQQNQLNSIKIHLLMIRHPCTSKENVKTPQNDPIPRTGLPIGSKANELQMRSELKIALYPSSTPSFSYFVI